MGGSTMDTTRVVAVKKIVLACESACRGVEAYNTLNNIANGGESSKKKRKKRKKSLKLSSPNVENGRDFDEPRERIGRDATNLSTVSGYTSQSNGDFTRVMEQTRESSTGSGRKASVTVKASGSVNLNKKKRKRVEEERQKESNEAPLSSVAATDATTIDRCGDNTVVSEILTAGKKIVVTNTKEGAIVQNWLKRQKGTVFGLDAEWRPSFRKGTEHKVAVLQICGDIECLIVQMLYLDAIPKGLVNFLKDPAIKFSGVGVQGDFVKLKRDWGLECNGAVDLTSLAAKTLGRPELKAAGLKALAKVVMDYDMAKPKRVTISNWAKQVLDKVQVEYAVLDAWASYAIHQKLFQPAL